MPNKQLSLLIGLLLGLQTVLPALAQSKPNQRDWEPLFNGKDLTGWDIKIAGHQVNDNYLDTYRVENGMIRISYDKYKNFDKKFGHMYYNKPYSHRVIASTIKLA
jgi:hypothetical protein